jgi:hypothetical protein
MQAGRYECDYQAGEMFPRDFENFCFIGVFSGYRLFARSGYAITHQEKRAVR